MKFVWTIWPMLTVLLIENNIFADTLYLKEVLKRVQEHSPIVQSAYEKYLSSSHNILPSYLPPNPQVTYKAMFMENNLSIGQPVPFPTKLITKGMIQNLETRKYFSEYKRVLLDAKTQAKIAFYELYFYYKAISITQKNVGILRRFLEVSRRKYEAGLSTIWDPLRAEVELSKLENELVLLSAKKISAQERLKALMGLSDTVSLGVPEEIIFQEMKLSPDSIKKIALTENPDILINKYEEEKMKSMVSLSLQNFLPDFIPQILYNTETGDRRYALGISLPLFFLFKELPLFQSSKNSHKASKEMLENTKLFVLSAINEILAEYESAIYEFNIFKNTILPRAKEALENAETGYIAGRIDFLTLLDSEKQYLFFELGYYRALSNLGKVIAKLERITGVEIK